MSTLKELLLRTHKNLQVLKEREAKQGSAPDLKLVNQIEDHQEAIELIEQSLRIEMTDTGPTWRNLDRKYLRNPLSLRLSSSPRVHF
jgi:hypothetical protein